MPLNIICPHCKQELSIPESVDKSSKCPRCQQTFPIAVLLDGRSTKSNAAPAPATSDIRFELLIENRHSGPYTIDWLQHQLDTGRMPLHVLARPVGEATWFPLWRFPPFNHRSGIAATSSALATSVGDGRASGLLCGKVPGVADQSASSQPEHLIAVQIGKELARPGLIEEAAPRVDADLYDCSGEPWKAASNDALYSCIVPRLLKIEKSAEVPLEHHFRYWAAIQESWGSLDGKQAHDVVRNLKPAEPFLASFVPRFEERLEAHLGDKQW
jgi:hypothetical protein